MSSFNASYKPYDSILKTNFASSRPLVHSGPSQHLSYSTGRRNVLALHGTLKLFPFHDVAGIVTNLVKSVIDPTADTSEGLVWGLTLGRGEFGLQGEGVGVWAVVNKSDLKAVKGGRWDLVGSSRFSWERLIDGRLSLDYKKTSRSHSPIPCSLNTLT